MPTEALKDAFEEVRSLGKDIELTDVELERTFMFLLDGILLGVVVFSRVCSHGPVSSSPTGVNGMGRLTLEALEGVATPSSTSCSRIWHREVAVLSETRLPPLDTAEKTEDAAEFRDRELRLDALLVLILVHDVGGWGSRSRAWCLAREADANVSVSLTDRDRA